MRGFPSCYAPHFADNMYIVGLLSGLDEAARAVHIDLAAVGIELQQRDSSMYIPTYNTHAETPAMLAELHVIYPHMHPPWVQTGIRVFCFPLCSDDYVQEPLKNIADSITSELHILAFLEDGCIHLGMLRLCVNVSIPRFHGEIALEKSKSHAKVVDDAIRTAFVVSDSSVSARQRKG